MALRKPTKDWNDGFEAAVSRLTHGKAKFLSLWKNLGGQDYHLPVEGRRPTHLRRSSARENTPSRPATKLGHRRIPSIPVLDLVKLKNSSRWQGKTLTDRNPSGPKLTNRPSRIRFERLPLMHSHGLKAVRPLPEMFPPPPLCGDIQSPLVLVDLDIPATLDARPLRGSIVSPIGKLETSCNCDQTLETLYDSLQCTQK